MRRVAAPPLSHADYQIVYDWKYAERHFYQVGLPVHRAMCGAIIVPLPAEGTFQDVCRQCTRFMRLMIYDELGL